MATLRGELTEPLSLMRARASARSCSARFRSARSRASPSRPPARDGSFAEDPLLDQLLLHHPALRQEPALLETLLELQLEAVDTVAVLLDRHDHPAPEALRVAQVV